MIRMIVLFCRLKEAQLSVKRITGEKKVETRKINPNSLVRPDFDRMWLKYSEMRIEMCLKPEHIYVPPTERTTTTKRSIPVVTILNNHPGWDQARRLLCTLFSNAFCF